jgi:hypothetical protein
VDIAHIESLVEEAYSAHAQAVIAGMKSIGREGMQSGEDSPYQDLWEEFAAQIQGQQSVFFSMYESTVGQFCYAQIDKMSPAEFKLLWLFTEPGEEWTWDIDYDKQHGVESDPDEDVEPPFDENDVEDALYRKVCDCAMNLELPSEEDDEEDEGDKGGEEDERIATPVTLTLPLFD